MLGVYLATFGFKVHRKAGQAEIQVGKHSDATAKRRQDGHLTSSYRTRRLSRIDSSSLPCACSASSSLPVMTM